MQFMVPLLSAAIVLPAAFLVLQSVRARARVRDEPPGTLTPYEVAVLGNGAAVLAALTFLYTSGRITGMRDTHGLRLKGSRRQSSDSLEIAVLSEIDRSPGTYLMQLERTRRVGDAVDGIRRELRTNGYLEGTLARAFRWIAIVLTIALAGATICAVTALVTGGSPTIVYVLLIVGGVAAIFARLTAIRTSGRTRTGKTALKNLRAEIPAGLRTASWRTIGAPAAAMVVALYGSAAVWAGSPGLATAAAIPRGDSKPPKQHDRKGCGSDRGDSGGDSSCGGGGCGGGGGGGGGGGDGG